MEYELLNVATKDVVEDEGIGVSSDGRLYKEGVDVSLDYIVRWSSGLQDKQGNILYNGDRVLFPFGVGMVEYEHEKGRWVVVLPVRGQMKAEGLAECARIGEKIGNKYQDKGMVVGVRTSQENIEL